MLAFVAPRQLEILPRRFLRLLEEPVQQHHAALLVDVKEHSGGAVPCKICSHLIDAFAERLAHGHADGPADLDCLDVFPDSLPVFGREQALQPFPHRFSARVRTKKDRRRAFSLLSEGFTRGFTAGCRPGFSAHQGTVPYMVHPGKWFLGQPRPGGFAFLPQFVRYRPAGLLP